MHKVLSQTQDLHLQLFFQVMILSSCLEALVTITLNLMMSGNSKQMHGTAYIRENRSLLISLNRSIAVPKMPLSIRAVTRLPLSRTDTLSFSEVSTKLPMRLMT